jgi:pyruvate carboxylase
MLLRGANAVGYTSYPQNNVEGFIDEAAARGIDVFRVFDSLNDLDSMEVSVQRVLRTGKIAEVAMCYTGDVDNPSRTKYGLEYYAELARRIEGMGAHILCIKDMAGLLRPQAARMLISALREVTSTADPPAHPRHLGQRHRHLHGGDRERVHIVDVAAGADGGADVAAEHERADRRAARRRARPGSPTRRCSRSPTTGRRCASSTRPSSAA